MADLYGRPIHGKPLTPREREIAGMMLDRLFVAMDTGRGIHEMMREDERAAGRTVVVPGDVPWLPVDDWDPTVVVSVSGNHVRLVALLARRPGNGALRRLLAALGAAGLEPAVVEPTREMQSTLQRRGWKGRAIGHGFTRETVDGMSDTAWVLTVAIWALLVAFVVLVGIKYAVAAGRTKRPDRARQAGLRAVERELER